MSIKTILGLVMLGLGAFCLLPFEVVKAKGVQLVKVVDGDTVRILKDGQKISIRLYGIDAPEKKQKYGADSTRNLEKLLQGKELQLQEINKDRYGRTVGILYANRNDVNMAMLENGHAFYYGEYCKKKSLCTEYKHAEEKAKARKRGLWAVRGMQKPSDWRKANK